MVASASDFPTNAKGKVIINAQLLAAPGQADKVQAHLTAVKKYSLSDAEPGTLEYRTVRSFVTEGGLKVVKFAVFEVYENAAAVKHHFESPHFKELVAAAQAGALTQPPQVEFFYEFE